MKNRFAGGKNQGREGEKDVGSSLTGWVGPQVVQVTMESGLGHRTVPMLLAESSFTGLAKNWSSLLNLSADMTLEVRALLPFYLSTGFMVVNVTYLLFLFKFHVLDVVVPSQLLI